MQPKQVKIGPQIFKIEFRDSLSDGTLGGTNYGYTLDQGNLIVIAKDLSLSKQQVTLMHEILHAMRMIFENGMPKKKADFEEWEHFFIGVYENSFLMLMRDNPELMEWFNGK